MFLCEIELNVFFITEVRPNEQHYNMKRSSWDVRTLLEVFSREFTHKVSIFYKYVIAKKNIDKTYLFSI